MLLRLVLLAVGVFGAGDAGGEPVGVARGEGGIGQGGVGGGGRGGRGRMGGRRGRGGTAGTRRQGAERALADLLDAKMYRGVVVYYFFRGSREGRKLPRPAQQE